MSVQMDGVGFHVSPDDFQAIDPAGFTYAVKFKYLSAISSVIATILEKIDGDWIDVQDIDSDVNAGIIKAGSPQAYADTVIRPAVKTWLAARKLQTPSSALEVAGLVGKWVAPL